MCASSLKKFTEDVIEEWVGKKDTQQKPPYDNECKKNFDSLFGEDKD